jgi:beta-glucosidase
MHAICSYNLALLSGTVPALAHAAPPADLFNGSPRITATSVENELLVPALMMDNDVNTRWSSSFEDNQQVQIDLVETQSIESLTILWNSAAANRYTIERSLDGEHFEKVVTRIEFNREGEEQISFATPFEAKSIRLVLHERATEWGFSIHELKINGFTPGTENLPEIPEDAIYKDRDQPAHVRARDAVGHMSLGEKIRFLSGDQMFYFPSNERLGLRRIFMADASMGLRIPESTAFPSFISLAATFDPDLAARYGDAVAEESRAKGVDVLLGPGVNLYRVPQGGRNFEYLGEDPFLASEMVVPYIRAVQDRGVMATVKHFAANNHEWHRKASNSVVDERTLRELYFPAFRAAIEEADVAAVMMGYNLVNGEYAAQNPWLIETVLRDEWGFNGLVMTDWWSVYDALRVIKSGTNLEMPHGDTLNVVTVGNLLSAGLIEEHEIDRMVRGTLTSFFKMGFYDREQQDDTALGFGGWHDEVSLETSRKSMTLLRNEGGMLPLHRDTVKRVVLIGSNARETETSGYGAARVEPTDPVSILDSFRDAAGPGVEVHQYDDLTDPQARRMAERADAVFVSVNTREREANDRDFELNDRDRGLILAAAALSDKVGVLLTVGSGVEMGSWIDQTQAVMMCWFAGNTGNQAVGEIVFGDTNPSGRLPFSIARRWEESAAYGNFLPSDATFNDVPIWGRERAIFPVEYREGLLSGYRHFDADASVSPLYGFGHGLSYTSFAYESGETYVARPSLTDPLVRIGTTVTNTGDRRGAEVVQLYVGQPDVVAEAPVRVLAGFQRVELDPGESMKVEFELDVQRLRHFSTDPDQGGWIVSPGTFRYWIGASSQDLREHGGFELD